jgi:hypothetical protein
MYRHSDITSEELGNIFYSFRQQGKVSSKKATTTGIF